MRLIQLLILCHHALSTPISSPIARDGNTSSAANLTALNTEIAPSWFPSPATRGTWDLLYSCLFTIGLCVWTAVHVNVPRPHSSHIGQTLRKLVVVLVGLLVPEAILYIAFRELREAYTLKCDLNEEWNKFNGESQGDKESVPSNTVFGSSRKRWTPWSRKTDVTIKQTKFDLTYGFYCGGFVIDISQLHNNRDRATLTTNGIRGLARRGKFLEIDAQIINDKSKADFLAKGLVCLQISWAFLQCVARKASGYPITILELHTLVHIVCAIVIYGLWLQKPLNITDPTKANLWLKEKDLCLLLRTWGRPYYYNFSGSLEMTFFAAEGYVHDELDMIKIDQSSVPEPTHSANTSFTDKSPEQTLNNVAVPESEGFFSPYLSTTTARWLRGSHIACNDHGSRTWEIGRPYWSEMVARNERKSYKLGPGDPLPGYPKLRINPLDFPRELGKYHVTLSDKDIRRLANTDPTDTIQGGSIKPFVSNFAYLYNVLSLRLNEWKKDAKDSRYSDLKVRLSLIALCTAYGAVHMAACIFTFPSATEKLLWTVSCIVLMAAPSILFCLQFFCFGHDDVVGIPLWIRLIGDLFFNASVLLWINLHPAFMISRVYVIVESFLSLRHVPIGVYDIVTWANYIPHL